MLLPLPRTPCPLGPGIPTHHTPPQKALEDTPTRSIEHSGLPQLPAPLRPHPDHSGLSLPLVAPAAPGLEAMRDQERVRGDH